jgi:hypothetical protein
MPREVIRAYVDPLDAVWLAVARGVGLRISRSSEVYASTDGAGSLVLGTRETLDADDCLAQMIFHELCHAIVQGHENLTSPDWGLDNESDRDFVREHACLRLQATLAAPYGLRTFFAPTTDFRAYFDALPDDALSGDDPAVPAGHRGAAACARAAVFAVARSWAREHTPDPRDGACHRSRRRSDPRRLVRATRLPPLHATFAAKP